MNISFFEYMENFSYSVSRCFEGSLIKHTGRYHMRMNHLTLLIGLAITLAIGLPFGLAHQQDARGIVVHGADSNGANGGIANGANGNNTSGANGTNANGANGVDANGANG
jgi:hypothetical protein